MRITAENLGLQGQRFDLADFITPAALQALTGQRFDVADTAVFLRQITQIYEQTYDIKYADLKARKFIPVDSRVNPGADSFVWRQFDRRGVAHVVNNYADDFPNAEVVGKEYQTRVLSAGVSYQYTLQDLRAASMAGFPLETRKANTARRVMEELIENVACTGMVNTNAPVNANDTIPIYGLTNFPNILQGGTGGYTTLNWLAPTTTVAQVLADVNALQKTIFDTSLGVHTPTTLLLPTKIYSYLATTPRSPTFTEDTMLQYILKQSPWLKEIDFWAPLDTAGLKQDTVTIGPRIMLYEKNAENLQLVIPQEFEQLPPQMIKMSFVVPCHSRFAGVTVRYPKSIAYLDGATG
jgi:hypothetical protein